jgi:hypothetical protein
MGYEKTRCAFFLSLWEKISIFFAFSFQFCHNILSSETFVTFDYIEGNKGAFLENFESVAGNTREVNENITAVVGSDESVTFLGIKPLDLSL